VHALPRTDHPRLPPGPAPGAVTGRGAESPDEFELDPGMQETALHALVERLRESEARFRTMADCAPVMLWMAETDGLCTFFNKCWLEFTGRPMEREYGNGWAEGVCAEDFEYCMHTYLESFVRRRAFRMEYRLRRADGAYRWLLDTGIPRFSPAGQFAGYIGSCIDITEIREAHQALQRMNEELEQRVAARTAELQRTNEELQQFAYVASHDLQAPLRTITGYISLLQKRYHGRLDNDADEFLDFITEGARHMQALIRDLLAYSRAGRSDCEQKPVDCNALVVDVLHNLHAAIEARSVRLVIDPLPVLPGDRLLLGQLFQNLIDNAIKFGATDNPLVRVNVTRTRNEYAFAITDNGIGIDPAQIGRLFRVFQRLHRADEYSGTGIGLAICKKVVERHGGRIWVESAPGQGSSFQFTLPATAPDSDAQAR